MSRIWIRPAAGLIALGLLSGPMPAQPRAKAPPTKRVIELPTKKLIAAAPAAAPANPAVKPGDVTWHPSFAAARAAAQKSGKPVLLFQMLGRLDQEFT
jgi:hypothetical protein